MGKIFKADEIIIPSYIYPEDSSGLKTYAYLFKEFLCSQGKYAILAFKSKPEKSWD